MKVRWLLILGDPVAQGRPRFSTRGGFARAYDPEKSRKYKARVSAMMRAMMDNRGHERIDEGPVGVAVDAYFPRPKSNRGGALERQASRPDAENVAKIILDAANGIAWRDDAQVAQLTVRKFIARHGEDTRVEVRFMPIEREVKA